MANRALDLMAKVSSRFVHEILPVATASVIGAMLVNHYGPRASPSVVVQAQPSASEDAMAQSLRDEHELIADFVKRREEFVRHRQEMDADHPVIGATQAAWIAPALFPVVDPPLPEPRSARPRKRSRGCAKSRSQEEVRAGGGVVASVRPSGDRVRDAAASGPLAASGSN